MHLQREWQYHVSRVTPAQILRVSAKWDGGGRGARIIEISRGADGRARTDNLLFTKQLLCH